jgi:nicotinic acetylcholine receptor
MYFIINLIFPSVVISIMSLVGFLLPPQSGEKMTLEIVTLVSILMISNMVAGILPESSLSVPKIGTQTILIIFF